MSVPLIEFKYRPRQIADLANDHFSRVRDQEEYSVRRQNLNENMLSLIPGCMDFGLEAHPHQFKVVKSGQT